MSEKFLKAAQQGDIKTVSIVLERNGDILKYLTYCHKRSGDTAAHLAARHGHVAVLKVLQSYGDHFKNENLDGKRPLHEAALSGQIESVNELWKYLQRNVGNHNISIHTNLRYTTTSGTCGPQDETLLFNTNKQMKPWTPLMLACTKHNLNIVQELVRNGAKLTLKNKDGWNNFHIAAREGNQEILNYLLDDNHNIWNTVSKNKRTPLHTAALHGKSEAVHLLLERCNYTVDDMDSCGTTPLMDAIRADHTQVAELLITKHKADYQKCDVLGRQPIHLASQSGAVESIDLLIKYYGVSVDAMTTKTGLTPLHLAAKEGQNSAIQGLLSYGANVNLTDFKGRTALHMAAGGQHTDCVSVLLQSGSHNCTDDSGTKPSDLANKPEIIELFTQIASDVDTAKSYLKLIGINSPYNNQSVDEIGVADLQKYHPVG
ncbi:ankyrin repeat domain-containing protein 16-like [Glandiceps talaboti]